MIWESPASWGGHLQLGPRTPASTQNGPSSFRVCRQCAQLACMSEYRQYLTFKKLKLCGLLTLVSAAQSCLFSTLRLCSQRMAPQNLRKIQASSA